jgi:hypothetical protein
MMKNPLEKITHYMHENEESIGKDNPLYAREHFFYNDKSVVLLAFLGSLTVYVVEHLRGALKPPHPGTPN